ncbi:MAG: TrkA family potassium uptake protein [Saccharofermentans sp.]|nr:TrkA family potassium uptake protein [Saccharofermentans sp.]
MNKSFAILGMGKFGQRLAQDLYESGADVLIADEDEDLVNQFADKATYAMTADLADPEALAQLGLSNMDVVVICMSRHIEASIMCAMVAKEAGVPKVIAKASSKRMKDILLKVGADEVSLFEEEAASRTARKLLSSDFIDFFELGDDLCIINMYPKEEWVGKSLLELGLRLSHGINVVAIDNGNGLSSKIDPNAPLSKDNDLLCVLSKKDAAKLK